MQSSDKHYPNSQYLKYNLMKLQTDLNVNKIFKIHPGLQWDGLTEENYKTVKLC